MIMHGNLETILSIIYEESFFSSTLILIDHDSAEQHNHCVAAPLPEGGKQHIYHPC